MRLVPVASAERVIPEAHGSQSCCQLLARLARSRFTVHLAPRRSRRRAGPAGRSEAAARHRARCGATRRLGHAAAGRAGANAMKLYGAGPSPRRSTSMRGRNAPPRDEASALQSSGFPSRPHTPPGSVALAVPVGSRLQPASAAAPARTSVTCDDDLRRWTSCSMTLGRPAASRRADERRRSHVIERGFQPDEVEAT